MGEQIDEDGFPRSPRFVGDHAWFYEESTGLHVVQLAIEAGPSAVAIPWRKVCAAVDRYRKVKAAKKKRSRR